MNKVTELNFYISIFVAFPTPPLSLSQGVLQPGLFQFMPLKVALIP